jgi:GTP-binding protein Era
LKLLSTASRLDIEDFVGKEVYLELKVKVKENWRENEELLDDYGYNGKIRT